MLSNASLKRRLRAVSRLATRPSNFSLSFLPQNRSLEDAISMCVYHHQDPRSMLSFTKGLMDSTLISLASPVGPWDPYDIKPQVFALDTYLGIPVFTSLPHLAAFCRTFEFSVRDPSGNIWADASPGNGMEQQRISPPRVQLQNSVSNDPLPTAEPHDLFDMLSPDVCPQDETKRKRKKSLRRKRRVKNTMGSPKDDIFERHLPLDFWERIESQPRLGIKKATPLPMFGPLLRPYFIGYFADVETLLQNASIAPEKTDIIVNPTTPIEIVLDRGATDRVLRRDTLILNAYHKFEKQIRAEFSVFFEQHCPEVSLASSACVAKSNSSDLYHNYIDYTIVVVVRSENMMATFHALVAARRNGALQDHPNLEVLPDTNAAAHARSAASPFYQRMAPVCAKNLNVEESNHRPGVMRKVGPSARISVGVQSDSFFSDPSHFYTESSFVFADDMKANRR